MHKKIIPIKLNQYRNAFNIELETVSAQYLSIKGTITSENTASSEKRLNMIFHSLREKEAPILKYTLSVHVKCLPFLNNGKPIEGPKRLKIGFR